MNIPSFLKQDDDVMVVAGSYASNADKLSLGISILESWGLNVIAGEAVFDKVGPYAGNDEQRKRDLQLALNDRGIRAIFLARGGYGITRIIDDLDFTEFERHPKWICGFSDVTALHLAAQKRAIASLHAPMVSFLGTEENASAVNEFRSLIFGESQSFKLVTATDNDDADFEGAVVGGNLSMVIDGMGTPNEIATRNRILFLEEVGEKFHHLDRMLTHMRRTGKLQGLKGVLLGHFSEMEDGDTPFGKSVDQILKEHFGVLKIPIVLGVPSGHENPNYPIPLGMPCRVKVRGRSLQIEWKKNGGKNPPLLQE